MNLKRILRPFDGLRGVLLLWFVTLSSITAGTATILLSISTYSNTFAFEEQLQDREEVRGLAAIDAVSQQGLLYATMTAHRLTMMPPSDFADDVRLQNIVKYFPNLRRLSGIEFLMVTDVMGRVLVRAHEPERKIDERILGLPLNDVLEGRETVQLAQVDGRMAIVAVSPILHTPVNSPDATLVNEGKSTAGAIVLGYYFDNALARRIKEMTSVDIVFIDRSGTVGTTLGDPDAGIVAERLKGKGAGDAVWTSGESQKEDVVLGNKRMDANYMPLKNQSGKVVGVMATVLPDVEFAVFSEVAREVVAPSILVSMPLALVLAFIASRVVAAPIKTLAEEATRIGSGELDKPIVVSGYREIISLGENIDTMRYHLSRLFREEQLFSEELKQKVQQRTEELSALFGVSQTISASLDITSRLRDILRLVVTSLPGANGAAILLHDAEDDHLKPAASVGFDEGEIAKVQLRPGESAPGIAYMTRCSIILADAEETAADIATAEPANHLHFENAFVPLGGLSSTVFAPLTVQDQCLGVLLIANVSSIEGRSWAIQILADSIAVAIANSKLYRDLQQRVEELKQTQALLVHSEKMASIGQLAAGVAHEINNPIGFINSNLDSLTDYVRDLKVYVSKSEETQQVLRNSLDGKAASLFKELDEMREQLDLDYILADLENVVRESMEGTQRVKKIVQDLKTFARADSGEMQLISLNAILESALNIVWNQLKYTCTVAKEYGEVPDTRCNANQIGQVFVNIMVNAGQAIGPNRHGEIKIRTYAKGKAVFTDISDNGKGISPEHLNKIFDPFFTTKPVGQGTGLGLSISYSIIEKHGGKICVQSELGVGTTFTVELPIVA